MSTTTEPKVPAGEWDAFDVEQWRDAMFSSKSFFTELFDDTTDFLGRVCKDVKTKTKKDLLLVEVGCGTGEALLPNHKDADLCVGMDYNKDFIGYCKKVLPAADKEKVHYFDGDGQVLDQLIDEQLSGKGGKWDNHKDMAKVVCALGNTVGIMPESVKQGVYQQMMEIAGEDGIFVVVFWNGNQFGNAVQNFYNKNPKLCGKFNTECIDLDNCVLETPTGYRTHWTTPEEARDVFENQIGAEVIMLEERGNGVLVAGRMPKEADKLRSKRAADQAADRDTKRGKR